MAIPGLLYQKIQGEFPERRQQRNLELSLGFDASEVRQHIGNRIHFGRTDGSALVQLGADVLVVNLLPPYTDWETFRAMILGVLGHYNDVAKPAGIKSMALRYVNRIRIPATGVEIEDYLLLAPSVPKSLPQTFIGWGATVSIPMDSSLLRITTGSGEGNDDDTTIFLLDIEVIVLQVGGTRSVDGHLNSAHGLIEKSFEECITDKARMMFQEEVPHEHAKHA